MTLTIISNAQTIIQPGDVSGTWTLSGSPYEIQGDITIPNDSTLTIQPGVLVEFQGHYALNVQGRLLAVGTEINGIWFIINDTTGFHNPDTILGGWNGIQFIDTPTSNDTSKIIFCTLVYGKAVGSSPPNNSGGAIFISNFNKVLISNCLITNSSAGGSDSPSGGGISLHFASITLENNVIGGNCAWDGGGIKIWESDPVFINNSIISNSADEGGGGVWIGGLSNCEFNYDNISHNQAGNNGGGMLCWQTTNTVLNSVNVLDNSSNWGGGIGVINCELSSIECLLTNNSAISLGGGLASDYSTVYIYNTEFAENSAGYVSGAIHSWYSDMQIMNCGFGGNESDLGGAIHSDFSEIELKNSNLGGNKAIDGGAIHTLNTNLSIDSCSFTENEAENIGGAIQYHIDTTEFNNPYRVEILNSRFLMNSAFYRGALEIQQLYSESSLVDVRIDKCEFIENAIDRGGNLLISGFIDDFIISNSIFRGNTAVLRTATCNLSGNVKGQVINCLFTSNHTPGGGAASSIGSGSNVSFINCTFANNIGGAALTFRIDAHSTLINNIFWGNENYNIIVNAVNDTTPCTLNINYSDIQYGLDSIVKNDTVSVVNWGPGNINEDPLFADTLNNDFHLQDMSPCIAVGIDSIEIAGFWYYAPLTDIEGNPRPNPIGTMPDMGAYESPYIVNVEDDNLDLVTEYVLNQNYPNPFNPSTNIKWQLPETGFVTLKIYDVLGNEVATLVKEEKSVGSYEVEFNASNLPSGIYFYRLQAGSFVETKKMVLMK